MNTTCAFPCCNRHAEKNGYCIGHRAFAKQKKSGDDDDQPEKQEQPERRKPINAKSEKLKAQHAEYVKIVKEMLAADPYCELRTPACTQKAQGLHHMKGRGKYLLVRKYLKRACNACNGYVENHPQYALEHGLSVSKLAKEPDEK